MPDPTYNVNPNVVATTLDDDESVLLDVKTRRYYSLNETGTRIWELLAEGQSLEQVVTTLTAEYEVDEDDARQHVDTLVSELESEGLIEKL